MMFTKSQTNWSQEGAPGAIQPTAPLEQAQLRQVKLCFVQQSHE